MTYSDAIQFLYGLRLFGSKLGLQRVTELAAQVGNPHQKLKFIHVAGTNGKGSTCAMLESIYRAAGLRTGLFTSPHLVTFRERIQVNRRLISEEEVAARTAQLQQLCSQFPQDNTPTFFEVVTIMALLHFAEQPCDIVIWETGLGGRLDATNIVTPLASVITNIALDHQKWLGQSEVEIAREKAGIIKPGVPVVVGEERPPILAVITEAAKNVQAPVTRVTQAERKDPILRSIQLPLLGDHQLANAALAISTVRVVAPQIPVSDEAIKLGLSQVDWPGRMQVVRAGLGRTIILDGAHNPAGAEALRAALQKHFPGTLATLIFGTMQDKDWLGMCRRLVPLAGRVCLTAVRSERTARPEHLQDRCREINPYAEVLIFNTVADALKQAAYDPLVVVTGSIHLVGEAMEALQLAPVPPDPEKEKALNNWQSPQPPP